MSSFFSDLDEETPVSSSFFSDLDSPEPASKLKKAGRIAAQYGIGLAQTAAGPIDIALEAGSKKIDLPESFKKFYGHKGRSIPEEKIKEADESAKDYVPPDFTVSGLSEKIAEKLGYNLKPEDAQEIVARFSGNLFNPKSIMKLPAFIKNLTSKEAKNLSKWKSLESASKGDIEKTNLLDYAKQRNLSAESTSAILKGPEFLEKVGKVSKKSKKYKSIVKELDTKLGSEYENLKNIGRKGSPLNLKDKINLEHDLNKTLINMGETYFEGPDTKSAREAIEKAISNISSKEGTVADLINSRQGLSEGINWNNIDKGDFYKEQAKTAFMNAIERKNPEIAKKLRMNDKDWSKYKILSKRLKKEPASIKIAGVEVPATNLAFVAAPFTHIISGGASAKLFALKEAAQLLSQEMIFNPKLAGVHKKLVNALNEGSVENQKKLLSVIINVIKHENPDLYKKISEENE